MPPEVSLSPAQRRIEKWLPTHWRAPLAQLIGAWLILSLMFRGDWAAMAHQWWDSSTYNHILIVPIILAWLVWQRREALSALVPQGWWPGLIVTGGALFLWLLGAVSGVDTARQLGLVLTLIGSVLALLGPRIGAALTFPLGFALFLVPVGDEIVPTLQMITAKIVIYLTHLSGILAEIDGVFIDTPAGLFEVAEACSGVKFLVAMIALGVLTCHLCFRSWWRRAAFMALAVAVPIIANGIRAWGTIYLAQSYGVEFAAGFDHIFYGWVFFAIVIAILLAIGWRFFDRPADEALVDARAIEASALLQKLARLRTASVLASGAILGMAILVSAWAAAAARVEAAVPSEVALPEVEGWQLVAYRPSIWWEPRASGADHRLLGRYRDNAGREADIFVAIYAGQGEGREAGGFGEGALVPDTAWRWVENQPATGAGSVQRMQAGLEHQRVAATFFRHGHLLTGQATQLRLATMRSRIFLDATPTVMLIVSAEEGAAYPAIESVAAFIRSVGPIGEWMDGFKQLP